VGGWEGEGSVEDCANAAQLDFGRGGYDHHTGVLCVNSGGCEGEWQQQR
jgi:hypothetical protein